jgi:hypothetical protein
VCVAELLVAIRIKLIGLELGLEPKPGGTHDDDELGGALHRATALINENRRDLASGAKNASDIAGDGTIIAWVLGQGERWTVSGPPAEPAGTPRHRETHRETHRENSRGKSRGKRRRKRASWQAAYNAACLYAALAAKGLADQERVVTCLRQTVESPHSEMERPSDWIERDPDLSFLAEPAPARPGEPTPFKEFLDAQKRLDYPAAFQSQSQPQPPVPVPGQRNEVPQATLRDQGHQPVAGDPLGDYITRRPGRR